MISGSYELCMDTQKQASSYIDIWLHTMTDIQITGIRPLLRATTKDDNGDTIAKTVRIRGYVNNVLTQTVTVTVDNFEAKYYTVPFGIYAQIYDDIEIYIDFPFGGATCYWDYLTDKFPWGFTGAGTSPSNTECANCTLDVDYAAAWVIDGQNEGYPHPTGYDIIDFKYFEKNEKGYPKNWGVWKFIDDVNEGYPVIVTSLETVIKGALFYKTEDGFKQILLLFCKTENGFVPLPLFAKTGQGNVRLV